MKDRKTLLWIYKNSKNQLFPMIILILVNALYAGCSILFALACKLMIDTASLGDKASLGLKAFYLLSIILFQFTLRIICKTSEAKIQARLEKDYKTNLLHTILLKDYIDITKIHSGELLNRFTTDITIISEGITTMIPALTGQLTKLTGALAVLGTFDLKFSLSLIIFGLILFLSSGYFRVRLKNLHKRVQEKDGCVRSFIQEVLENLIVIKIFGIEERMEEKADQLQKEHFRSKMDKSIFGICANAGFSTAFAIGYLYALIWCCYKITIKTISFGTLTAVLQLVGQVQSPFSGLSGTLPKLYGVLGSAERIMELENIQDEPEAKIPKANAVTLYTELNNISFNEVSFQYDRDYILYKANIMIKKGEFVMISGTSGIGKSTLLKLLSGILSPDDGNIQILLNNGRQIPVNRYIRGLFAYVPQRNLMITGTIRENITLFRQDVSEKELTFATRISCVMEFINDLPHGFYTVIGERGQGLSEGQLQRIAIARALLYDAPILLLDEATSALDEATEENLLQNLKEIKNKTIIIVSHKKAALTVCNKVIRILNRKIITIEEGDSTNYDYA